MFLRKEETCVDFLKSDVSDFKDTNQSSEDLNAGDWDEVKWGRLKPLDTISFMFFGEGRSEVSLLLVSNYLNMTY